MNEDLIGQTIANYQIMSVLGKGGMGVVYKAWQASLKRFVALKILSPDLSEDSEFFQRFLQEAHVAAQLSHPNIVVIHDVGTHGKFHYLAMEFITGRSLGKLIEEQQRLSLRHALHLTRQVADALAVAHEMNVIHCDIKPANIMVDQRGKVKVLDFGIAKLLGEGAPDLTVGGFLLGTPEYMSPEQWHRSARLTGRSDIYLLGVTLYHMLAGRPPFTDPSPMVVAVKTLKEHPPNILKFNPTLPEEMVRILDRMLAKNPLDRYDTARNLMGQIDLLLSKMTDGTPDILVHGENDWTGREEVFSATDAGTGPEETLEFPSKMPEETLRATAPAQNEGTECLAPSKPICENEAPEAKAGRPSAATASEWEIPKKFIPPVDGEKATKPDEVGAAGDIAAVPGRRGRRRILLAGAALLVLALIGGIGLRIKYGAQARIEDKVVAKRTPIETPLTTPAQPPEVKLRWTESPGADGRVITPQFSFTWEADNTGEVTGYNVLLNGEAVARQITQMSYTVTFKTAGRQQVEIVPILRGNEMGEALKCNFTYENRPPTLNLVDPAGESIRIKEGKVLPIRVDASDPGGENVHIEYRIDQGPWLVMTGGSAELGPLRPTRHELELRVLDQSGLSSSLTRWIEVEPQPTPSPTLRETPTPLAEIRATPLIKPTLALTPTPRVQETQIAKMDTTPKPLKTEVPTPTPRATPPPMPRPTPAYEPMTTPVLALTPTPAPTLEAMPIAGTITETEARVVIDRIAKVITAKQRGIDVARDYYLLIDKRYRLSMTSPSELHSKLHASKESIAQGRIEYLSVDLDSKQSRGNEFGIKVISRDNGTGRTEVENYRIKLERQDGQVIFAGDYKIN